MSNDRPTGSPDPGAGGEGDADAPDAWDEPEAVHAADRHGREAREYRREYPHEHDESRTASHFGEGDEMHEHDEYEHEDYEDGHGHPGGPDNGHDDYDDAEYSGAGSSFAAGGDSSGGKPLWRRLLVYFLAAAVLFAGIGVAFGVVRPIYQQFTAPSDYEGAGSGSAEVVVEPGDTGLEIGQKLQQAGVVMTAGAFAQAITDNPGDELQPGHYALRRQMAASEALSLMRTEGRDVTRVTIREGLWKSEVYAELSKVTGVPVQEYQKAEEAVRKQPSLVGLPASANGAIEGYLFPATYEFDPGTDATAQLRAMVSHSLNQLRSLGVKPENMERVMTVASLVEGEARRDEDRAKVARVIENRLKINMALQMDSTVNYAAQRRSITTSDKERAASSPYNTYAHPGLPPGPINNPGSDSITAAQNPADGDWLYFVTTNPTTGETVFTSTLEEHNAQVRKFQQWCQANPGKC